jgi:hypothetical protein
MSWTEDQPVARPLPTLCVNEPEKAKPFVTCLGKIIVDIMPLATTPLLCFVIIYRFLRKERHQQPNSLEVVKCRLEKLQDVCNETHRFYPILRKSDIDIWPNY